jgi:hypothetical protein
MFKAKCSIACGNKYFEAGKEYTKKEIEGLDINDFDVVDEADVEVVETSMTTESVKPKTAKKTNKK